MASDPLDVFVSTFGPTPVESTGGQAVRRFPTGGSWRVFDGAAQESQDALRLVRSAGEISEHAPTVIDLLTMWELAEATGFFSVTQGNEERGLFFVNGKVGGTASTARVDVAGPDRRDRILDEMLEAEDGVWTWSTVPDGLLPQPELAEPLSAVLMDALRRQDESRVYRQRLPSLDRELRLIGEAENQQDILQQRVVAALSTSPASLRTLASLLLIPLHDVLRASYELARRNTVSYAEEARVSATSAALQREEFVHAFGEIAKELTATGAKSRVLAELTKLVDTESGRHADIWRTVQVHESGVLDLSMVPSTAPEKDVSEALSEFVLFAAMQAARGLGRRRGRDLIRRVRMLLSAGAGE